MDTNNPELESFRRQWREEVSARASAARQPRSQRKAEAKPAPVELRPPSQHPAADLNDDDDVTGQPVQGLDELTEQAQSWAIGTADEDVFQRGEEKEPESALEHFEKAVEREEQGSLGDSLSLYRKAYKLDAGVDRKYRLKHFPPSTKTAKPTAADVSVAATQDKENGAEDERAEPLSTPDLLASFAHLSIPPAEPIIEGDLPPPCPIASVPSEVIIHVLQDLAESDPAAFSRLSLVCKRFAYHVAHEQHIWKRVCQGSQFGFAAMQYSFACDVHGRPTYTLGTRYTPFPQDLPYTQVPKPLLTWSQVFQMFPRIRFTGIYISTVNYTRPGAASSHYNSSWNSPIHIVTYYRYLRFYPDGAVVSLLSTTEPVEVVPHICRENLDAAQANTSIPPAQTVSGQASARTMPQSAAAAMKKALRGRWHLTKPSASASEPGAAPEASPAGPSSIPPAPPPSTKIKSSSTPDPRDLVVETEGVDSKYTYTMHLALRPSSGSARNAVNGPKNTRLVWRGFWSYNQLTDDWAEFGLRNDRAFVFRRVRGWGMS